MAGRCPLLLEGAPGRRAILYSIFVIRFKSMPQKVVKVDVSVSASQRGLHASGNHRESFSMVFVEGTLCPGNP
jgi:hypothetical protein